MTTFRTSMPINDAMAPPTKFRHVVEYAQRGRQPVKSDAVQSRPRSSSGSRSHVRSNDLIQGVYDRLGVARGDIWSKTPAPSDDVDPILRSSSTQENNSNSSNNSTGGNSSGRPTYEHSSSFRDRQKSQGQKSQPGERGRSSELTSTGEIRSRSTSRSEVKSRWPPALGELTGTEASNISKNPIWRALSGSSAHNSNTSSTPRSKFLKTASSTLRSPYSSPVRTFPAKSLKQLPSTMNLPSLEAEENNPEVGAEENEAGDNTNEGFSSVKERMRRFSGGGTKTTGPRLVRRDSKKYAASLSVRQLPPKVNVYAPTKAHTEQPTCENVFDIADEKKDDDAGTDAEVAMTTKFSSVQSRASSYMKSNSSATGNDVSSRNSRFKAVNKLSSSYLSSTQTSPKPQPKPSAFHASTGESQNKQNSFAAPVSEISTQMQDTQDDDDASSIAMSSVSQDDRHLPTTPSTRRTTWQNEKNRVKGIAPASVPLDTALINKMIDDRVQAHVADMETRLGAQMRRFMQQMDDKILERLEKMESKVRDLHDAEEAKRAFVNLGHLRNRM